jgi:hypothetical protein
MGSGRMMNEQTPIAIDIYERKEMMAEGKAGSVYDDLAETLEQGNLADFEDYFGDQDPFEFL